MIECGSAHDAARSPIASAPNHRRGRQLPPLDHLSSAAANDRFAMMSGHTTQTARNLTRRFLLAQAWCQSPVERCAVLAETTGRLFVVLSVPPVVYTESVAELPPAVPCIESGGNSKKSPRRRQRIRSTFVSHLQTTRPAPGWWSGSREVSGGVDGSRYPRAYARGTLDQNPKSSWSFSWPLSTFS
jgi:hypothetical protein